jgi:hypothetical protein
MQRLTQAGYHVEQLPPGDYQINLQFDPDSGELVVTHEALHGATSYLAKVLGQRIVLGL